MADLIPDMIRTLRWALVPALLVLCAVTTEASAGEAEALERCRVPNGPAPLHDAVRRNALEDVRCLVKQGYPLDALGRYGSSAISLSWIGLENRDDRVLKYLLRSGADPTAGKSSILARVISSAFEDTEEVDGNREDRPASKIASALPFYFKAIDLILSFGGNMNAKDGPLKTSNTFNFIYQLCELPLADEVDFKHYIARVLKGTKGTAAFQAGETKWMKQTRSLARMDLFSAPCIDAALEAFGEDNRI